ncbi:hypothetical protein [Desulfosarcina widdelii]|uniref:hypothetical protein n=1 Tax=Desulfosarcina widdelii TaxID=947919 RepID=UPI0012D33276|nr:hypothetical protein [Desulfosarcina widdelii]
MYLYISKKDIECLIPSSVLLFEDQHGKTSLPNSIPIPDIIIKKSKAFSVPEFLKTMVESVREADEKHHVRSMKVFITKEAIDLQSEAIVNSIVSLLNEDINFTDYCLAILLKPDKHFLRELIFVIEDRQLRDAVRRKLSRKKDWSKFRKLTFVLDCLDLDLDRNAICKRHFIHQSAYPKYLKNFSKECEQELCKRLRNIQTDQYGKEVAILFSKSKRLQVSIAVLKNAHRKGFFLESYSADFQLSHVIKDLESLAAALDYYGRLFPYITHLVPDRKLNDLHPNRKSSSKAQRLKGNNKPARLTISELKKEVGNDYAYLLKLIQKIQLLKGSIFPISKLRDFWPFDYWDQVFSEKAPAHEITLEILSDHYDVGMDRLRQVLTKSPRCK